MAEELCCRWKVTFFKPFRIDAVKQDSRFHIVFGQICLETYETNGSRRFSSFKELWQVCSCCGSCSSSFLPSLKRCLFACTIGQNDKKSSKKFIGWLYVFILKHHIIKTLVISCKNFQYMKDDFIDDFFFSLA